MRAVVLGGGTMGSGIASVLARARYEVDLVDARSELASAAVYRCQRLIDDAERRGRLTAAQATCSRQRVRPAAGLDAVQPNPRVIVEAVPERRDLKRRVLAEAEGLDPALLATNTSSISIDGLASDLAQPERFLGLHFFNPVPAMPLVEVVLGSRTGPSACDAALDLVAAMGKESIVIRDAPGFATSRLGVLLGLEAIRMVETGIGAPEDIDRAMELGYRHPMGPLRLTDVVGLDVRLDIARQLAAVYGPRFEPPDLLVRMVDDGRIGKKVGHGFYDWSA